MIVIAKHDDSMNKFLLVAIVCLATSFSLSAQQNSFLIIPRVGLGFADGTTCLPFGLNLGYEFSSNRISLNILTGAKKRTDYSNGDYKDALITNVTLSYSKIFKTKKIQVIPDLGAGLVSGSWKRNSDGNGEHLQTGFGLTFGCGAEYPVKEFLSFGLSYAQALLFDDFSGNGAILCGVVFKI